MIGGFDGLDLILCCLRREIIRIGRARYLVF